ncbi:MAG: hypothetical protein R2911_25900 [Caldilineaceae bacterium]
MALLLNQYEQVKQWLAQHSTWVSQARSGPIAGAIAPQPASTVARCQPMIRTCRWPCQPFYETT